MAVPDAGKFRFGESVVGPVPPMKCLLHKYIYELYVRILLTLVTPSLYVHIMTPIAYICLIAFLFDGMV